MTTVSSYGSIEPAAAAVEHDGTNNDKRRSREQLGLLLFLLVAVGVVSSSSSWNNRLTHTSTATAPLAQSILHTPPAKILSTKTKNTDADFPMPTGVNWGSWLSLEDYFFSANAGTEVATPDHVTIASDLPPLVHNTPWQSETDLFMTLMDQYSVRYAVQAFVDYRRSFYNIEEELSTLRELGMFRIRVPVSWCLTELDPADFFNDTENQETTDEGVLHRFACRDPSFHDDVWWPAVPKPLLVELLQACAKYGIKAIWDVHTYPGGTSPGTFSGVWPRWPRFWTYMQHHNHRDNAMGLWNDLVTFVEGLEEETLQGLYALAPMNEPAHLAGMYQHGKTLQVGRKHKHLSPFLPPLPPAEAKAVLESLNKQQHIDEPYSSVTRSNVPNGPHLRVFAWLQHAIDVFRQSSLPSRGIHVAINVHESVLTPQAIAAATAGKYNDAMDEGGRHPGALHVIAAFWRGVTSRMERESWAILDVHHYHAWEPQCLGSHMENDGSNYTCHNQAQRTEALQRCASWATWYREIVNAECGGARTKLVSGEMSVSTHHNVQSACIDRSTLEESYRAQLAAASQANVSLYFWSWKMPYGGSDFRPAWSLSHFLYLMDHLVEPDEWRMPVDGGDY